MVQIFQMLQNVSNTGKKNQTKPKEINMTKSVDNGEILPLDNESLMNLCQKKDCCSSIEEQMIEFRKKIMKKNL